MLIFLPFAALAQDSLALKDAVRMALARNHAIAAAQARSGAADQRISEARAGYLPKLNYSESWTRSDNPVFVFSSLLTQHQFGAQNFAIGPLNRPDFMNNFQSTVTADQTIYDAGHTRHAVRSAEVNKDLAGEGQRQTEMDVIGGIVEAYYGAVLSQQQLDAAVQAVRSAEADLRRAQDIRTAGMSTDSDVLSLRVHLASVEEERIRRSADLDVARAGLNDLLALPLDSPHLLSTSLSRAAVSAASLEDYEARALKLRPEAREAKLAAALASEQAASARGALKPEVSIHAAFEADRQNFYDRGGANWLLSAGVRWNVFNGFGDKARISESEFAIRERSADQERAISGIRLQVREAWARLRSAEQRIEVASASVAEAEESLRITRNRYEAGMSDVTALLRTETALLDTRTRYFTAVHDQRIAATLLELAAGSLTADSEVLN